MLITAVLTASLSGYLQAQSTNADATRAAELIAQATQITLLKDRGKLARLYEQAGNLLPVTDPRTSSSFVISANAYYLEGKLDKAAAMLEKSVAAATARGANTETAESMVKAIFVAAAQRDAVKFHSLKDRAMSFVVHNDLPEFDRIRILRQLTVPLAASAAPTSNGR